MTRSCHTSTAPATPPTTGTPSASPTPEHQGASAPPLCRVVHGDLLTQPAEAIVNAWNRNLIPCWLLLPQGVSGAIKKKAGTKPFRELSKAGVLPLGGAFTTSAGNLPYRGIIHVAGIGYTWTSSETSIRTSVRSAISEARIHGFNSLAFPLIGAGTGGFESGDVEVMMLDEIGKSGFQGECIIVKYQKDRK